MEIETEYCKECGADHTVCGDCGGRHVTPVDYIETETADASVTQSIDSAVLDADDGDEITIVQVCWDCGAKCHRTLDVSIEHE